MTPTKLRVGHVANGDGPPHRARLGISVLGEPSGMPQRVLALGAEAVRRILDIQDAVGQRRDITGDEHLAVALLDALDEFVDAARRTLTAPEGGTPSWVVGRDSGSVAHAVARDGVTSACGLIGFVEPEDDDWRFATGRRCRQCATLTG